MLGRAGSRHGVLDHLSPGGVSAAAGAAPGGGGAGLEAGARGGPSAASPRRVPRRHAVPVGGPPEPEKGMLEGERRPGFPPLLLLMSLLCHPRGWAPRRDPGGEAACPLPRVAAVGWRSPSGAALTAGRERARGRAGSRAGRPHSVARGQSQQPGPPQSPVPPLSRTDPQDTGGEGAGSERPPGRMSGCRGQGCWRTKCRRPPEGTRARLGEGGRRPSFQAAGHPVRLCPYRLPRAPGGNPVPTAPRLVLEDSTPHRISTGQSGRVLPL